MRSDDVMKKRLQLLLPVFAVAAILSACGSSSSSKTDAVDVSSTSADTGRVVSSKSASGSNESRSTDSGSMGSSPTTVADATGAIPAGLKDCLAKNGVTLPEGALPSGGAAGGGLPSLPAGVDAAAMQKAFAACQAELPKGAAFPGAGAGAPDISAFIVCLKDNGVNVPDNAAPAQLPAGDPKFAEASKTCAALLPNAAPGAAAPDSAEPDSSTTIVGA